MSRKTARLVLPSLHRGGCRGAVFCEGEAYIEVPSGCQPELVRMVGHRLHVGKSLIVDNGIPSIGVIRVLACPVAPTLLPVVIQADICQRVEWRDEKGKACLTGELPITGCISYRSSRCHIVMSVYRRQYVCGSSCHP